MTTARDTAIPRRRALGAMLAGAAFLPLAPLAARPRVERVLFVCQFGSVKSAIARELTRRRARERGVPLLVRSRGITPEAHLAPAVRDKLAAEGIDPAREPLRRLRPADLAWADRVVIFNPLPGSYPRAKVADWSDTPSMNDAYALTRPEFDRRIDALLDEIAARRR